MPSADVIRSKRYIPGDGVRGRGVMEHGALRIARDLRQARSARRAVLRGDDLRDAVARSSAGAARDCRRGRTRPRARSACTTARSTPNAASTADGVFVLEIAARPIGGPVRAGAARSTVRSGRRRSASRNCCCGTRSASRSAAWTREAGGLGRDDDPDSARAASTEASTAWRTARARCRTSKTCVITAKADQTLVPLPEGASYLGFIFARARHAADVESALRAGARAAARSRSTPALPVYRMR